MYNLSLLSSDLPRLKNLIEKQQNLAKKPIMDTDSMDTAHVLSSVEQRTHNPLVRSSNLCDPTTKNLIFSTERVGFFVLSIIM